VTRWGCGLVVGGQLDGGRAEGLCQVVVCLVGDQVVVGIGRFAS
jgi:hypothetical protein